MTKEKTKFDKIRLMVDSIEYMDETISKLVEIIKFNKSGSVLVRDHTIIYDKIFNVIDSSTSDRLLLNNFCLKFALLGKVNKKETVKEVLEDENKDSSYISVSKTLKNSYALKIDEFLLSIILEIKKEREKDIKDINELLKL